MRALLRRSPPRFSYARLLAVAAILGPFLWCFGPALCGARSFAFRDAAHYYYPLFQWSCREWAAGRVPLWNPQENCGVPVLADTTSSVLYPGKLLFALPLPYAAAYKLYVTGHVLLAAAAAFSLARRWAASLPAATLCAVSYAFGGNVVFQYCNVVFLVGAAWLPLALLATDQMLVHRSLGWSLGLGTVLALMVLGGDPHGAYHAGLLAALYAWLLWRHRRAAATVLESCAVEAPLSWKGEAPAEPCAATGSAGCPLGPSPSHSHSLGNLAVRLATHRFSLLALAAGTAAMLAAVQLLPATQWLHGSDRAAYRAPRSIYEVPTFLTREQSSPTAYTVARGLFGRPLDGTHHEHIYHFSVGPWRLAELLWPNFSGRTFPQNRRWISAIPAEGQAWTPSLYQGLLPLLLALGSWRLRGGSPRVRWLSWSLLLATLGSFGWFGLGWLIQEVRCAWLGADPDQLLLGQPVGGVYWWMVVALPGYAYFRYPAKLLTISALALSLLAAHGFDRLLSVRTKNEKQGTKDEGQRTNSGRWRFLIAVAVGLSLACWLMTFVLATHWSRWLSAAPDDALAGALDVDGSLHDLRWAFLQTAGLGACLGWLFSPGRACRSLGDFGRLAGRAAPALGVLLTAAELALAHGWMVPTATLDHWQRPAYFAEQIAAAERVRESPQPFRVFRAARQAWWPHDWAKILVSERQQAGLRFDRDTLFPKYHLDSGLSLLEADDTLASQDYRTFLRVARQAGPRRAGDVAEPHRSALDVLAARYLLVPNGWDCAPATRVSDARELGPGIRPANATLWVNPNHLPRAWIVHRIEHFLPLASQAPAAVEQRTREVLFPKLGPRDLREVATVESAVPVSLNLGRAAGNNLPVGRPFQADRDGLGRPSYIKSSKLLPAARLAASSPAAESCRIVVDEPQRVEIEAELSCAGLVVLSDLFCAGWSVEVLTPGVSASRPVPILRTNRILRGVILPPGRHRIIYAYRPTRFYLGAAVSLLAWVGVIGGLWKRYQRRVGQAGRS
ncbi:MAG: hypothetical protein NTY19_11070 [Planctomycetota bacterium]|nr:hypothetical protein [Planctomycetota bacterium]